MRKENKRVLITVKAYPTPSTKYTELVCVAGIDIDSRKWIRLFPIPFRDLESNAKFKKYNIIEVDVFKTSNDKRPESHKVILDSINIIDYLDTQKGKWTKRKEFVLPLEDKSMCDILNKSKLEDKSLGMFKPCDIEFEWKNASPEDKQKKEKCYSQLHLFNRNRNEIEYIPYRFRYRFKCQNEKDCPGHVCSIIDWEMGQCYRDWRDKYHPQDYLFKQIENKWLNDLCSSKKDVYFYVGNMKRFRDIFMVLGVFYPPII